MNSGPEGWRLYRLGAREIARSSRAALRRVLRPRGYAARAPERLLITPPDLRTSDATIANDIYAGYYVFAGRALATGGRSPFSFAAPSQAWGEALYGFGWLRHLRAANTALSRANARALVGEFLRDGSDPLARRPEVTARRLLSFLAQAPMVLDGADHAFYQRFMRRIGRDMRALERCAQDHPRPFARLFGSAALTYAGLCLDGYEGLVRRIVPIFARELDRQILPDGGHLSRNPRVVLELLLDLLPLKQVFLARGVEPPEALIRAVDRMPPMLRLLRHGDGTLALFNGMGATPVDHLTTLLFYDEARGSPISRGTISGYERLEAGGTVLIAEVGAAPPVMASTEAHAGCLSFELSSGVHRIVVNCGAPRGQSEPMAQAARATAAHSTVAVADTSSARFLLAGGIGPDALLASWLARRIGPAMLSGPREIVVDRPEPLRLRARHDGYLGTFGLVHERRWRLSADGDRLDGEDLLFHDGNGEPMAAAVRFHLHPSVRATRAQNGRVVMLVLPNRETWQFEAEGREPRIEESVFLAATDGARRSEQIVLDATAGAGESVVWRFERLARGAAR